MKERWMVAAKKADFAAISEKFHIDPVTARVIRNRDVIGDEAIEEYLHGDLEKLHEPRQLKGVIEAMDIIQQAIRQEKYLRIIGDYDIDGVVATYILVTGLKRLGAKVDTYIPDRVQDGYGMHKPLIDKAIEDGVNLIITCDNGIAAAEEIAYAKENSIDVIVTDHHNVPYEEIQGSRQSILPPADVIINPKQEDCHYPFKGLCGAAVAYKLIVALYQRYAIPKEEQERFLELVAVATVGDVMDLLGENRILVKEGLKRLQHPKNIGIAALVEAAQLNDGPISAHHIGFVLGPCINASGRLDTASRALELLESQDKKQAAQLAGDLVAMNESRKAMTAENVDAAIDLVETSSLMEDKVLVVYLPQCHESLAGIIAGRLRERFFKPTFVLTKGEDGVKGSGRSIEEYSMYDELVKCSDLLLQFGGHPMAAGLSLKEENIPLFRKKINELCTLTETQLLPKITIDVPMPISYVSANLVKELESLEPFGKANPRPLFAQKQIQVLEPRVLGKNRNVVQMKVSDGATTLLPAVYFGDGDSFLDYVTKREKIDIIYQPQIHSWQGRETLRLTIANYQ